MPDGRELLTNDRDGDLVAQADPQNSSTGEVDMINVNAGADHNGSDYHIKWLRMSGTVTQLLV